MIKVYIFSYERIYTEQANSMPELKRKVINGCNIKGFKFSLDPLGSDATTFGKFFKGVTV